MRRRLARLRRLSTAQRLAVLWALFLVPATRLSLRVLGFSRTARALARSSDRRPSPVDLEGAREAAEAVSLVAGQAVVGARCLGGSLALWFILRRRGIDAELVIGADAPKHGALAAHAWVEVTGVPVNDMPNVRERFGSFDLRLPRLGEVGK
jgi:Transglutaminase-like superfamily